MYSRVTKSTFFMENSGAISTGSNLKPFFLEAGCFLFVFFQISFLLSSICNEIYLNISLIAQLFPQGAVNLNAVTAGGRCSHKHSGCF